MRIITKDKIKYTKIPTLVRKKVFSDPTPDAINAGKPFDVLVSKQHHGKKVMNKSTGAVHKLPIMHEGEKYYHLQEGIKGGAMAMVLKSEWTLV